MFQINCFTIGMHIIAASCLSSIAEKAVKENNHLSGQLTAIPGLGLNPYHPNPKQRQFLLHNDETLRSKSELIIWHDVISNTISRHPNPRNDPRKEYPPADPKELCSILRSFKSRTRAILYCQRHTTTNIYHKLVETGIQIIDVDKKLISHRKKIDPIVRKELSKVYLNLQLERQFIATIIHNYPDLENIGKKIGNTKTPSRN